MFCPKCGIQNEDSAIQCVKCQALLQSASDIHPEIEKRDEKALKNVLPIGRSGLAVAAGYVGLFCITILPSPIAVVLGIFALRDIKKHPQKLGTGRAIFGLIMGIIGTIILVLGIISGLFFNK